MTDATEEAGAAKHRQAVVVIHGMGEQRPMATLRSFVEAVWVADRRKAGECRKYWVVPDSRTGSAELSRITTSADNGVRTDFYEFYWADIMQGTTLQHLRAWIFGLLLRWPHHVPSDVWWAWVWLWVVTLLTVALAAEGLFGVFSSGLVKTTVDVANGSSAEAGWTTKTETGVVVGAVVSGGLFYVLAKRLLREKRRTVLSGGFILLAAAFAFVGIGFLLPWQSILTVSVVMLLLSSAIGILVHQLVVPYLGDVARYVRSEPDTVQKRREIRERGLALLRALHREAPPATPKEGEGAGESDQKGLEEPERYERIVVVGHSLGSIIAYDLLRLFWLEAGPSRDRPMEQPVHSALGDLVTFLETGPDLHDEAVLSTYRELQRAVSRAMAAESAASSDDGPLTWRISDFITLGCPLTHAEFLLARDVDRLQKLVEERQIATSPPLSNGPGTCDFRYQPGDDGAHARNVAKVAPDGLPHHAAMFAATRWTNIYDRHSPFRVWRGDIVSGPVQGKPAAEGSQAEPGMGLGIRDRPVRIRRPNPVFPGATRFFTHTLYWDCDVEAELLSGEIADAYRSGHGPEHVKVLREAMALDDR
ncbi:hypothetical protein [Aurantimonas sp. A3-2-R12]|uniref:hypothetical protein n=1 Tax=Aurantimonas sp. A3-2-R12 TaxID=3114362 RepID=UPI002E17E0E1|nr:hypothetical protein [Aurantimonas sp. A3-2-R12]